MASRDAKTIVAIWLNDEIRAKGFLASIAQLQADGDSTFTYDKTENRDNGGYATGQARV
ncbi:MAG: hypothetical protein R3B84_22350 [Zavarzinella sp.]